MKTADAEQLTNNSRKVRLGDPETQVPPTYGGDVIRMQKLTRKNMWVMIDNHNWKIDHKKSIWDITFGGGAYTLMVVEMF